MSLIVDEANTFNSTLVIWSDIIYASEKLNFVGNDFYFNLQAQINSPD